MSFLHPVFLFGLFSVLIPVIIHLFDFRRTKKVYFSNTRLLHQIKESTRSFYNLKHLLILFTRILFITALVLAFAQPYLPPVGDGRVLSNKVAIFIDNSLSMSNKVAKDEAGLDVAKGAAIELINLYPAGTDFIIQSAFDEKSVYQYRSKQEAIDYIYQLDYTANSRQLPDILSNFKRTQDQSVPPEIILLSDFQRSTLFSEPIEIDTASRMILAPIKFEELNNLVVDTAYISNPFELDKSKTKLVVQVKNYSSNDITDIPVKLFLEDRQISVTSVSVPALATELLEFNIGYNIQNVPNGRIVIDDYPIAFDNELFFTIQSTKKVRVVEITEEAPSSYIQAVFGNPSLFELSSYPTSNINFRQLEESDLIIINQVNQLDAGVATRLNQLRIQGATILLIPGESPQIESYKIIASRLRSAQNAQTPLSLQVPDFSRPFFQNVIEKKQNNMAMPSAKAVWDWGLDRNALLKFIDGRPYLSELNTGLYLIASPLRDDYGGFQSNALFVPVMYRIAANSKQNLPPLFYRLNDMEITLDGQSVSPQDIVRLSQGNLELFPDQRLKGRELVIMIPATSMKPGHYDVLNKEKLLTTLALNLHPSESNITLMNEAEIIKYFNGNDYKIIYGSDQNDIITKFSQEYKGIELWRYFLGLALVFLFIEALLIRLL